MTALVEQRRFFAEEIETLCDLRSRALVEAFATTPRENFLPAGPWIIRSETDYFTGTPRATPDADPRRVYHNVAIAIDAERQLFNGAPSLLGLCIDRLTLQSGDRALHIGCGPGYYSALIGGCVGPTGHVVAIEVDETLAASARRNLATLPQAEVRHGDGTSIGDERFDPAAGAPIAALARRAQLCSTYLVRQLNMLDERAGNWSKGVDQVAHKSVKGDRLTG